MISPDLWNNRVGRDSTGGALTALWWQVQCVPTTSGYWREAGWGSAQGTVYGDTDRAPGPFEGIGGGWKCSLEIKALPPLCRSES